MVAFELRDHARTGDELAEADAAHVEPLTVDHVRGLLAGDHGRGDAGAVEETRHQATDAACPEHGDHRTSPGLRSSSVRSITARQSNADRQGAAKLWPVSVQPGILERGAWALEDVEAIWRPDPYDPGPEATAAADAAITALVERGSPAHDGVGARLVGHASTARSLTLEIQPIRWAMRLNARDAALSMAALCVTRAANGRWLAGVGRPGCRPGRAGSGARSRGAVDPGENPANTLVRELEEEWSVAPERIAARVLVCLPHRLVMFVGLAWLPDGAEVVPDDEHDAHAWWPAAVDDWPAEADANLRRMAASLAH